MWRTATRPKWLALLAAVVVVLIVFAQLGLWQLDVARDRGHEEALQEAREAPSVELTGVLSPHTPMTGDLMGRTVTVSGTYDASGQVVITDRRLGDQTGYWVVTPLVVQPTGARLAVIRGFLTDPNAAPAPPEGTVSLAGMLASSESAPNKPTALPSGQMQTIDLAELVNEWPGQLYNAILFPSSQQPPSTGVTHIPPPDLSPDGFAWRNLAYALQWWIFALFALYMWWRMVREEHDREQLEAANAPSGEDDAAAPTRAPAADEENKERTS